MNVFFLSGLKNDTRKRLQRVLEYMLPKRNIRHIRSIRELEDQLRKTPSKKSLALILYVGKSHLTGLVPIKELLEDTNLILILNENNPEIVSLGHHLRPRFITFADSDFLDVASVLIRMKEKMEAEGAYK